MLSIFSAPKAFRGHTGVIQRNAVRSWVELDCGGEVILFGDEEGVSETAAELGVRHERVLARNAFGTPLVSALFAGAEAVANHAVMCYVNADIILMSDFRRAVCQLRRWSRLFRHRNFLMIGRRLDLDILDPLEFRDRDRWEAELKQRVAEDGRLHGQWGIDYIVFRKGQWGLIPPFAVGRPMWDNWMVFRARELGIAVIDATNAATAVHQNHAYHSVGLKAPDGTWDWNSPEAAENLRLAGGRARAFSILDATWTLKRYGALPALTAAHLQRRAETMELLHSPRDFGVTVAVRLLSLASLLVRCGPRLRPYRVLAGIRRRLQLLLRTLTERPHLGNSSRSARDS